MVKGQALADFLTTYPLPFDSPINDDLYNEWIINLESMTAHHWELYLDGPISL